MAILKGAKWLQYYDINVCFNPGVLGHVCRMCDRSALSGGEDSGTRSRTRRWMVCAPSTRWRDQWLLSNFHRGRVGIRALCVQIFRFLKIWALSENSWFLDTLQAKHHHSCRACEALGLAVLLPTFCICFRNQTPALNGSSIFSTKQNETKHPLLFGYRKWAQAIR